MISIEKHKNNKYYLKINSTTSTKEFNDILLILKQHGITYDNKEHASYHKNPQVLVDCLYELADTYDTFISDRLKKEIDEYDPFIPSFKPIRKQLEKSFFEKYPPLGQYQIDDVQKMYNYGRVLNACKQGLGKSYSFIQTANQFFYHKEADKVLIVAISPVLYNWKRELKRFSPYFTDDNIQIITKDQRAIFDYIDGKDVLIMTYNTLKLVSDYYYFQNNTVKRRDKKTAEKIKEQEDEIKRASKTYEKSQIPFDTWGTNRIIVADEAHKLKNMKTRWTQIIHQVKNYFNYRYPMSGTPAPNNVSELFSHIKFLDDELIESDYGTFVKTIANVGTKYSDYEIESFIDYKVAKFEKRIKPYMIRRFLRDHLELPQVYRKKIYVELQGKHKELYQKLVSHELISIKKEHGAFSYKIVKSKFPFILQVLSDPSLLNGKLDSTETELIETLSKWKFEDSLKFQSCKEIIESIFEDNKDSKVVIWSEHPNTIEQLAKEFDKYGVVIVHGQSTPKGRENSEWRDYVCNELFKNDVSKHILISNPTTIGVGTNLQYVQNVITYDEGFSFVDKDQKDSRFERSGMIGEVTYWKIIVDDSLEIYQDKVIEDKTYEDRMLGKDKNREVLTMNDINAIFKGE